MFKRDVESGCAFSPDARARDRKGTEELRGLEPALLCEFAVWLALVHFPVLIPRRTEHDLSKKHT